MEALDSFFHTIGTAVDGIGAHLLQYALVLAAVGTLAMALVELSKSVFRLRMRYNRWCVRRWTQGSSRNLKDLVRVPTTAAGGAVLPELVLLSVGAHDYEDALYDQPVEKMMGQVQAAVQVAMEYPNYYPNLYNFITQVPEELRARSEGPRAKDDQALWKSGVPAVEKLRAERAAGVAAPKIEEEQAAQAASQARARLNNLVARKLDAFQCETQYFWERLNQWAAALVAMVIFVLALYNAWGTYGWVGILLLSIPAGVVAPFAKQLVGALSSFGK